VRTHYENDEETTFDYKRPLIMTSIEDVVTRGDLLSRTLKLNCPRITEDGAGGTRKRQTEKSIDATWQRIHPTVLGALLDAVAHALAHPLDEEALRLPRLADFFAMAVAAEPATGLESGAILKAFDANAKEKRQIALESSPVGLAALEFARCVKRWSGTTEELRKKLTVEAGKIVPKAWPTSPRGLSGILRRLDNALRAEGLEIQFPSDENREGGTGNRVLTLIYREPTS
jgi:hypothetical protein